MNVFLTFVFNIFILIILFALIDALTINEKISIYLKPAVSVVIILTVIGLISKIDFDNLDFNIKDYNINTQAVWQKQSEKCEEILEKEMLNDCRINNINIDDIQIDVSCENNEFKIVSIKVSGKDKLSAKNYISGKYRIGLAYIIINGD